MSETPPEDGRPNEAEAPPAPELPKSVSYAVIGITILAIGGYAIYAATRPVDESKLQIDGVDVSQGPPPEAVDPGPTWPMEGARIDPAEVVRGGPARDQIPALVDPKTEEAASSKLDPRMRVIGVEVGEAARAYPINLMNYHEVINDTLGGQKILVTFCPLCDVPRAWDRKVGDEVLEFGVSGLLYRSNMLIFDRRDAIEKESLWTQIDGRAATGPLAAEGRRLTPLPARSTTWGEWKAAHPTSTVLSADTGHERDYSQNPYAAFLADDTVNFPLPERSGRAKDAKNKSHVAVVELGDLRRAYFFKDLKAAGGPVKDRIGDQEVTLVYEGSGVRIEGGEGISGFTAHWFAIDVLEPTVELWDGKALAPAASGAAEGDVPAATGAAAP